MKKSKLILLVAVAICFALIISACTSESTEPAIQQVDETTPAPIEEESAPPEVEEEEEEDIEEEEEYIPHFPVEIVTFNFEGDEIVTIYESAPERVLAVYQGSIETMIALGLEHHVIAAFGLDNELRPEWLPALEIMNYDDSVFAPERETVIMLAPDMIFSWGSIFGTRLGDVYYWIETGTNTYINTNTRRGGHPRTVENEFTDLLNIGRIFNVEYRAQIIVDEMQAEIDAALALAAGMDTQRVVVIEFRGDGTIANYPPSQLAGNMVERLGGELAITDVTTIGYEDLLAVDPDVIFVIYMERVGAHDDTGVDDVVQTVLDNPALGSLSAVQNGRVHSVQLGEVFASAVRTLDGIRSFAHGMYPELAY